MTTIVFLHAPRKSPFDWQDVADHLPPAWAVAAPQLNDCTDMTMVCQRIEHDARGVSDEPIVLVSDGLSVLAAHEYQQRFPDRVHRIVALQPRYTRPLSQWLAGRKTPYLGALGNVRKNGKDVSGIVQLMTEETQYPAQCAAALYRVMTK